MIEAADIEAARSVDREDANRTEGSWQAYLDARREDTKAFANRTKAVAGGTTKPVLLDEGCVAGKERGGRSKRLARQLTAAVAPGVPPVRDERRPNYARHMPGRALTPRGVMRC